MVAKHMREYENTFFKSSVFDLLKKVVVSRRLTNTENNPSSMAIRSFRVSRERVKSLFKAEINGELQLLIKRRKAKKSCFLSSFSLFESTYKLDLVIYIIYIYCMIYLCIPKLLDVFQALRNK